MIEIEDMMNGTYTIAEGGENLAFCDSRDDAERIKRALERESMTVIAFEATPEQDATIENVLDLADIHFAATGATRTDTLVAVLADWRKRVEHDTQSKPRRTDNGDGTVTFPSVPVTVRAEMLEGRDVIAVRAGKEGERCLDAMGIVHRMAQTGTAYRIILGPKPQPPEPQQPPAPAFREGGFYRTRGGELAGPLEPNSNGKASRQYPWQCNVRKQRRTYTPEGTVWENCSTDDDLLPGEVIVWRNPTSMPADTWDWRGECIRKGEEPYIWRKEAISRVWADWADPPRAGKWLVREGQEYATWEGE